MRPSRIMGKHKTDRTEQLKTAAKRYIIAEEANNHVEQHNFDRMVAQGFICVDPMPWPDNMIQTVKVAGDNKSTAWWPVKDKIILKIFGVGLKKDEDPQRGGVGYSH